MSTTTIPLSEMNETDRAEADFVFYADVLSDSQIMALDEGQFSRVAIVRVLEGLKSQLRSDEDFRKEMVLASTEENGPDNEDTIGFIEDRDRVAEALQAAGARLDEALDTDHPISAEEKLKKAKEDAASKAVEVDPLAGKVRGRRLPAMSEREVERILLKAGFEEDRRNGTHATFEHPDGGRPVVMVIGHGEMATRTRDSIFDVAGIVDPRDYL